jgi:hypothetical protein
VADDVLEHFADVLGSDEHRLRASERLASPGGELDVPPHRVLELRAVRFHDVARARRRCDRPAEHDVIREDDVGGQPFAQRHSVQLDVALALRSRQLR